MLALPRQLPGRDDSRDAHGVPAADWPPVRTFLHVHEPHRSRPRPRYPPDRRRVRLDDGWRVQLFTDAAALSAKRGAWVELAELDAERR